MTHSFLQTQTGSPDLSKANQRDNQSKSKTKGKGKWKPVLYVTLVLDDCSRVSPSRRWFFTCTVHLLYTQFNCVSVLGEIAKVQVYFKHTSDWVERRRATSEDHSASTWAGCDGVVESDTWGKKYVCIMCFVIVMNNCIFPVLPSA